MHKQIERGASGLRGLLCSQDDLVCRLLRECWPRRAARKSERDRRKDHRAFKENADEQDANESAVFHLMSDAA